MQKRPQRLISKSDSPSKNSTRTRRESASSSVAPSREKRTRGNSPSADGTSPRKCNSPGLSASTLTASKLKVRQGDTEEVQCTKILDLEFFHCVSLCKNSDAV